MRQKPVQGALVDAKLARTDWRGFARTEEVRTVRSGGVPAVVVVREKERTGEEGDGNGFIYR